MYIGATESIRKYAVIKYPWNIYANTPRFTGIPPHVMLMVKNQELKQVIEQQTAKIIEGVQGELDMRQVRGDRWDTPRNNDGGRKNCRYDEFRGELERDFKVDRKFSEFFTQ